MQNGNIMDIITQKLKDLPESQRVLGEFILKNYKYVANLSAIELGNRAGVSDATVVRFAKSIGYSGYPEIKNELFEYLIHEELPSNKMIKSLNRIKKVDSGIMEVFQNDINNIEETFRSFRKKDLDMAVEAINSARRVYVIGLNSCESLASFLNFHLRRLDIDVHLITSAGLVMFEQLSSIKKGDALVVISYPRYSKDALSAVELAKSRNAKTISISDQEYSPIAQAADISLIAHSTNLGFYNSYAAATTMCNVLVLSIALVNEEKSLQALKSIDEIKDEIRKDIYI